MSSKDDRRRRADVKALAATVGIKAAGCRLGERWDGDRVAGALDTIQLLPLVARTPAR